MNEVCKIGWGGGSTQYDLVTVGIFMNIVYKKCKSVIGDQNFQEEYVQK